MSNSGETDLYAKHVKIQPRQVEGVFSTLRNSSVVVLLAIYYLFPWVNWSGRQAVLWDLPNRKFYIFELVIWPQDFFFLAALLIIAALALFFFTTVAGRLWCGYACPQTVWAKVLLWIEEFFEGGRNKRIRLDKAPWSGEKMARKGGKYFSWVLFAFITGFTFVGYFSPIRDMVIRTLAFNLGTAEVFWIGFYALMIWLLGAVMREQVCIYMCPYARFQSVMYDPDTLLIAYDEQRGEPRAKGKRTPEKNLGSCVDCSVCVQACPMGIDIRDGLQYQCTGCALCIDACDEIMDKTKQARGLIRYTTENRLEGKQTNILRPRVFLYGIFITGLLLAVVWGLLSRNTIALDIIRDRNTLYRDTGDGQIENIFRLRIMNKDVSAHRFTVDVHGLEGAVVDMDKPIPEVASGSIHDQVIRVKLDSAVLNGARSTEFEIILTSKNQPELQTIEESRYLGPIDF